MKVQRVVLPNTIPSITWPVLDDEYVPVQPILAFLKFCNDLERSPHTIRAWAYHDGIDQGPPDRGPAVQKICDESKQ
jgi:hypothetical protein